MDSSFEHLNPIIKALPAAPGVYQFINNKGEIIYVGKAKNLRSRVRSYFNKKNYESARVKVLTRRVSDISHIVVESEADALLLENNLIKKNKPRYNVLLKDDKTFPYICLSNERFPRVYQTRKRNETGALYFGPYTSVQMVKTILELIKRLHPLRTCNYKLTEENIRKKKFKVCLEYHIGNCKGPCEGKQTEKEYNENIRSIKNILNGNIYEVKKFLIEQMQQYSTVLKFEEAQIVKEKLEILEKYRSKSVIVNPALKNIDVFSYIEDDKYAYVNYIKVSNGAIIQSKTKEIRKVLNEPGSELLGLAIVDILADQTFEKGEIIVPFDPNPDLNNKKITIPKIGDRKKLLLLSERNAKHFKVEKQNRQKIRTKNKNNLLEIMRKDLNISAKPVHIECFDISNILGKNQVAACVVFRNGVPSTRDYRHFLIKTVSGSDDYAAMKEVVIRRYSRLLEEQKSLPQLVVIDGGKGQLNTVHNALKKMQLSDKINVIAIAKKLEEIFLPGDPLPLYLDKNSPTLRIIQNIRNEAHRFGLRLHRKKRSAEQTESKLLEINGIGATTIQKLFIDFKSYENIKNATSDDLAKSIGKHKAKLIFNYFQND